MNEFDGHGRDATTGDRVPHNHHHDVLIAQGLGPPTANSLLRQEAFKQSRVLIGSRLVLFVLFTIVGRGWGLDDLSAEKLLG